MLNRSRFAVDFIDRSMVSRGFMMLSLISRGTLAGKSSWIKVGWSMTETKSFGLVPEVSGVLLPYMGVFDRKLFPSWWVQSRQMLSDQLPNANHNQITAAPEFKKNIQLDR